MEANANTNTIKRIRVNFKDPTILSKTQKKYGLKRSWVLLKPHHSTISDVVLDIFDRFDLHCSCPNGILLTMDGFALPPFESTNIFKDKDIVSVKRKGLGLKAITEAQPFVEDEIVEKPLPSVVRLLVNEEFDEEARGSDSEINVDEFEAKNPMESDGSGDVDSKKRKASSPIEISKKKRPRQVSPKSMQNDIDHCENSKSPQKKRNNAGSSKGEVTVKSTNNSEPKSESTELDEKKVVSEHASGVPNERKKASRSARRKKMQRHCRKICRMNNNEGRETTNPKKDLGKVSEILKNVDANIEQLAEEDSDGDGDLVPVEIRPGHIRFASTNKAKDVQKGQEANGWDVQLTQKSALEDHSAQKNVWDSVKNNVAKETFCWNGITNKRKGQKWGQENQPSWKESRDNNFQSSSSAISNQPTSSRKQTKDHNTQNSMDFEKLMPLSDSPKVGDILAYRLLELSSSWCPELSSFRVGKVTSFDQETYNILLIPEVEYPLNLEKNTDNDHDHDDDDDAGQLPQPSVYNEDGSLEIDFHSLADVRIVKSDTPSPLEGAGIHAANGTSAPSEMSKSTKKVKDGSKNERSNTGSRDLITPTNPANGKKDAWEEISEALSAKKAQLMQEDTLNKKEGSTKQSWSHRTLKSSALGPIMAMLRSQNGV